MQIIRIDSIYDEFIVIHLVFLFSICICIVSLFTDSLFVIMQEAILVAVVIIIVVMLLNSLNKSSKGCGAEGLMRHYAPFTGCDRDPNYGIPLFYDPRNKMVKMSHQCGDYGFNW